MATVRLALDISNKHVDGTSPIKLIVSHQNEKLKIPTHLSVLKSQWSKTACRVIKHECAQSMNAMLIKLYCDAQIAIIDAESMGEINLQALRRRIIREEDDYDDYTIFDAFQDIISDSNRRPNTRSIYLSTLHRIQAYTDNKVPKWGQMNPEWLARFDRWLSKNGCPGANGRGIHMRNIRAAFNLAIKGDHTHYYPFRNYTIKYAATRKRSMPSEQIRTLTTVPVKKWMQKYQDVARLIFLMRGINISDLMGLTKDNIIQTEHGPAIIYKRNKTGKDYQILIEPEMNKIFKKYAVKGSDSLLPFIRCPKSFTMKLNAAMRRITDEYGKVINNEITTYWLRHSWATIASEIDIPKETISAGLGHEIGSAVTSIYINFNQSKIDKANRKIIDYVYYKK